MKLNKACGPDGVPPGVFQSLQIQWIGLITCLFNLRSRSASYPMSWANAKMFTIFKRGSRKDPKNYREIAIIKLMAKLYDLILCARLNQLFMSFRELEGTEKGRVCIEHIVTLR